MKKDTLAVIGLALLLVAPLRGEDWPQFRGPGGQGVSQAKDVPLTWSTTQNIAWSTVVPGRGRSSPVLMGDRIWMTMAIETGTRRFTKGTDDMQQAERVVIGAVCLDKATGKQLWHTELFPVDAPEMVHWLNSYATPTPVVEPGRLYCDFGNMGTACLDPQSGEILWKQRLASDHQVGPGSSPILHKNLLILVRDGRDQQYIAALNTQTGDLAWKTSRPPIEARAGDLKKCFCTPLIIQSKGRDQLIAVTAHWAVSYDPVTGAEIWRIRHGDGFSNGCRPVFGHDLLYFNTGLFKQQLWAMRVDGQGEISATNVLWKINRQIPAISSPLLVGNEIYWVSDDGMASCANALTGQMNWQERLGGQHLASPLSADGRIYYFAQDGKCTVIKAGAKFERLAENTLEGPLAATPAIVDSSLFVRTDGHLFRIQTKPANKPN